MKVWALMLALGTGVSVVGCAEPPEPVTYTNCLVTKADRTENDGTSDARVYSSCGTFKVADIYSGPHKRRNSADVFGAIVPGETYTFVALGERIPERSEFPNILTATKTK